MKPSYILSMLLSASLLSIPVAHANFDKGIYMIEKQEELAEKLSLDAHQKKLWETYKHSLEAQKEDLKKIKAIVEERKEASAHNAVEAAEKRLAMREKIMVIDKDLVKNMKVSVTELKAFYASLNAQQKTDFDAAFKKMQAKAKEKMKKKG